MAVPCWGSMSATLAALVGRSKSRHRHVTVGQRCDAARIGCPGDDSRDVGRTILPELHDGELSGCLQRNVERVAAAGDPVRSRRGRHRQRSFGPGARIVELDDMIVLAGNRDLSLVLDRPCEDAGP